ncbi:uncharacterized protein LOC127136305 [Lathyrus oleraceus]|uniref:uncharacterized protein LOC127136305 n=1 Tax=Pisum sativum TaxID=3888 RepID=UPI0021D1E5D6|nr:uncharacterized protein LOC127136305 [Pisum sativum]
MDGRNDVVTVVNLQVVARAVQNRPNVGGEDEFRYLGKFQRNNLPTFKAEEADDWWINTRQVLDVAAEIVTLDVFRREFLRNEMIVEFSKCIKFENGLCLEIRQDSKARSFHYKRLSEKRGKQNMNCGKSYSAPADKDNVVTFYNYAETRHINTHCHKPKQASIGGNVFALTGTQTSSDERLIRGLVMSSMSGEMVIETLAKGSMNTTSSLRFLAHGEDEEVGFLSTRELKELLE